MPNPSSENTTGELELWAAARAEAKQRLEAPPLPKGRQGPDGRFLASHRKSQSAEYDEQRFTHQGKTVVIPEGTFAARDTRETHAKFWANQIAKDRARMEAMSLRAQS